MSAVANALKVGAAAAPLLGPAKSVFTDCVVSVPVKVPLVVTGEPDTDIIDGSAKPTEVTVPPELLELMVWFGQVPVMVTLVPATSAGVLVPVPPLFTFRVPPSVTAPVVAVEGVSPVDPALKVVTPPGDPFEAAVMRPWASTVRLVLVYKPGVTAVSASAIVPVEVIGPPVSPVPVFIRVTALPEVMVPHPEAV